MDHPHAGRLAVPVAVMMVVMAEVVGGGRADAGRHHDPAGGSQKGSHRSRSVGVASLLEQSQKPGRDARFAGFNLEEDG